MARSVDALQRRALKRNRTVEEQQRIENDLTNKKRKSLHQVKLETNTQKTTKKKNQIVQLGNEDTFADNQSAVLEDVSNVKQQQQQRQQQHHDKYSSKNIGWSKPQAPQDQVELNQRLRHRLCDQDSSLTDQERERARILLARDERAKLKKKQHQKSQQMKNNTISSQGTTSKDALDPTESATKLLSSKEQRKINRSLLKKYKKTHGLGMTEAEVTRVNQLLERKLRKLQRPNKPTENDQEQTTTNCEHDPLPNTARTNNDGNEEPPNHKKVRQPKQAKCEAENVETDNDGIEDNKDQSMKEPFMITQRQEEKRNRKEARKHAKKNTKKFKDGLLAAESMETTCVNTDSATDTTKAEKQRKKEKRARKKSRSD